MLFPVVLASRLEFLTTISSLSGIRRHSSNETPHSSDLRICVFVCTVLQLGHNYDHRHGGPDEELGRTGGFAIQTADGRARNKQGQNPHVEAVGTTLDGKATDLRPLWRSPGFCPRD